MSLVNKNKVEKRLKFITTDQQNLEKWISEKSLSYRG